MYIAAMKRGDNMRMPNEVAKYLDTELPKINWTAIEDATPDLCSKCPEMLSDHHDADDPVCLSCPWFGVLYSHTAAKHWRGYRHLKRIAKLRGDDPHHD